MQHSRGEKTAFKNKREINFLPEVCNLLFILDKLLESVPALNFKEFSCSAKKKYFRGETKLSLAWQRTLLIYLTCQLAK